MNSDIPLAFDIARVRAAMLEGILIPREIINESFAELSRQVKAARTYYFQKNGRVTDKREVADNGARLQAIDMVFSAAGLFKPDDRRGSGGGSPSVAIEVTKDGVIRIAVGSPHAHFNPPVTPDELENVSRPAAISINNKESAVSAQVKLSNPDEAINRFNTILDELDEE